MILISAYHKQHIKILGMCFFTILEFFQQLENSGPSSRLIPWILCSTTDKTREVNLISQVEISSWLTKWQGHTDRTQPFFVEKLLCGRHTNSDFPSFCQQLKHNRGELRLFPIDGEQLILIGWSKLDPEKNTQRLSKTHSLHQLPSFWFFFDHWIPKNSFSWNTSPFKAGYVSSAPFRFQELPLAEVFRRFEEASKGELEGRPAKLGIVGTGSAYETSMSWIQPFGTAPESSHFGFLLVLWVKHI